MQNASPPAVQDIKTMKLYHQVERVFNELSALGVGDRDSLDVGTLSRHDQYHYLGTQAVDEAIAALGIGSAMRVLEVGGGIGGPARYLAHAAGCHVTALELQPDLNEVAAQLTGRCALGDRVRHVCGDILAGAPDAGQYDALVSWLTFLHIPQRRALYARCFDAMKPGAGIYVEDYFERSALTAEEREALSREVYCDHVPAFRDYREELAQAGFEDIRLYDLSGEWTRFVRARLEQFTDSRERNVALHGEELVAGLGRFYSTIVRLFSAGNLGGIAFVARKPRE